MNTDTIEREAKLFEAGSYPDRGIDITEEDLERIAENTSNAPIRIEHMPTPFDGAIGVVKSVYRRGKELFGKLHFTRAAWELVKAANARRLSVALKKDKGAIVEVSLVREPRIADAAVFATGELSILGGSEISLDEPSVVNSEAEYLRSEIRRKDAQIEIDRLKRLGKLVPAGEVFARAILESDDDSVVTFGGQATPVRQLFLWFLDSQPKVIEFAELAVAQDHPNAEPDIYTKLGVTSDQVERYKKR